MLIRFGGRQMEMLTRRAQLHGSSLSEEVCDAVDFYLDMPVMREELQEFLVEANCAADRIVRRLDKTIARVDKVLSEMNSRRMLAKVSEK